MVSNDLRKLKPADEVAIMPRGGDAPRHVLKIDRVQHVGKALIRTSNGGIFTTSDGSDLNLGQTLYIEPATDEHRRALHFRRLLSPV